jgi:CubicO group peptidase (beta-lactamase class C family)
MQADGHNVRLTRLTRLELIGILFGLAALALMFTRMGGGSETDALALPSLEEATGDELDSFDDFGNDGPSLHGEDLMGEPTDEDLELTELASDADDALFDVEDDPLAEGIDPLTGRINDGEPIQGEPIEGELSDDPEGPVAFVNGDEGGDPFLVTGNEIDTGLDGREDSVIIIDGDGGNNDGVIVVDADGYSFADSDHDGDTVIIIENDELSGSAVPEFSSKPPVATFEEAAPEPPASPEIVGTMADNADVAAAQALLSQWLVNNDVSGARLGFAFPDGSRTYLTAGTEEDGAELDPDGEFLATSVTKTMTASIVFNLVSEGVLSLDDPAPTLGAVPDFGYNGAFTVRQLLQHTSGLASYQSSPGWSQDMELNALTALQLADDVDLVNTPGADRGYSNSGYLYLGLLSEQFTGTPFHELIQNRIAGPLGLESTRIDGARRPGWVGYSAGGLISSVPDLLTWGSALYRDGSVLEPAQLDAMLDVDNEHSTGLGANVICPCGLRDGSLRYTSIGHDGGSVTLQHSPADDMITSAKFTESFWTDDLAQRDVHGLLRELRSILTAR